VTASDNIMVTEVYIKILDGEGNVLEQGFAKRMELSNALEVWEYRSGTKDGTIEATASDLAGNTAKALL
jgi:hypothetical protein